MLNFVEKKSRTTPLTCQVRLHPSGGHIRSLSPTRNKLGATTLLKRRASANATAAQQG
jgi:hypothetical protein